MALIKSGASWTLVTLLTASIFAFMFVDTFEIQPVEAEVVRLQFMPDFGQHSWNWCWVASPANCFYWLKHYGGFPALYPDSWDEIAPDSIDPSNSDWYDYQCGTGYSTLFKEICKDGDSIERLVFCSRFFFAVNDDEIGRYVWTLTKFLSDQGFDEELKVRTYINPTFEHYKREIEANAGVIILYEHPQDIHMVTGVSYATDGGNPEMEVSDPGTPVTPSAPDDNNDPNLRVYDTWTVTDENTFMIQDDYGIPGNVHILFCIGSPSNLWTVDDDGPADFNTIQGAINYAVDGDTILVRDGTYYENIVVNKSVSIVGEDRNLTTIYGRKNDNVLTITADNVTITGFTVRNATQVGAYVFLGIYSFHCNGLNITNNIITETCTAIDLVFSDNNHIEQNVIMNNHVGVEIYRGNDNLIVDNIIENCDVGLIVRQSAEHNNNSIIDNVIADCGSAGIRMYSGSNLLRNNTLTSNHWNFGSWGESEEDFKNDIDSSNTADGKPIRFLIKETDLVIDGDTLGEAGYFGLVGCTNITVSNLDITNSDQGLLLAFTNSSEISHSRFTDNAEGICLISSKDITLINNEISGSYYGVRFVNSGNNMLANTDISSSIESGIRFDNSNHNAILHNTITSGNGITLHESSYNKIRENNLANCHNALIFYYNVANNSLHHNNFINYNQPIYIAGNSLENSLDNGYEGNYWSDYGGTDSDGDGIGDTPYVFDSNNTDNYPLMNAYWNPSDINHDLQVNMKDVGVAAKAFATQPEDPEWNPHADITGPEPLVPDSKVDMRDIGLVAKHFGEAYP